MKKIAKTCLIGAVICLCVVLVFLAGVCVYLNTDHARDLIQDKVNGVIPGKIIFSDFRFSPFKGKLALKNVILKDRHNSEIAGLNALRVELSWFTLLEGALTVKNVILEDPWANLYTDKSGELNLVRAVTPARKKEARLKGEPGVKRAFGFFPIEIRVKLLELAHGSILYERASSGLIISVKDFDLRAEGDLLRQSSRIVLQIAEGRIGSPKVNTSLTRCTVRAALQGNCIDELLIEANTPASRLTVSGSIRNIFKKPVFDLSLNVLAALPEFQKSLSLKTLLTGDIRARITARGILDNPEVTMGLTYGGGMLSGNYVDRASLDLILKERLVILNKFNVDIGSGNMSMQGKVDLSRAFKQGFIAPQRDFTAISYHVLLKGTGIRFEKLRSAVEHGFSGIVAFNMALSGTGLSPKKMSTDGEMEANFKEFAAGTLEKPIDLNVTTRAGLKGGVVTIKQLKARSGSLSMQSSGRFDLSSGDITVSLAMETPDLTETLSYLGIGGLRGACDIRGTLSGSLKSPAFDFALQGRQLRYRHVTLGNIGVNANLEQSGRLRVAMLSLENQGSLINATGSVKVFKEDFFKVDRTVPLNLSVTFKDVEMRDFFTKEIVKGMIAGQVNIDGPLQSLIAKGALAGKDLKYKAIHIGDCETIFRFSDGKLSVEKMEIRNHKSRLRFSGTAQVFDQKTKRVLKDPAFTLGVRGENISFEDFVDGLKGKVSLAATMEGSVRRPRGTIDLHGTNVDLGIQRFHDVKLTCVLDGQKAWFRPLHLAVAPGELIECSGWLTFDKLYQIEMISKGVSLGNIQKLKNREIAEGKIFFIVSGHGALENPQLKGDITLKNLRFKGKSFEDFEIHLDLHDKVARISGKLNFDVAASFQLQNNDFSATLLFHETDLSPYFRIAGKDQLSGMVTGKVETSGNIKALRQTRVYADFSQLALFFKGNAFIHAPHFRASLKNEDISIAADRLILLKEGHIDIRGKGKINGLIDFQAAGTIPLEVAGAFTPHLPDIAGDISLSVSVKGTWSHPDIQADIGLRHMSFTIPALAQKLHDINGSIRIVQKAITVEGLEGQLDTGRFDLKGRIEVEGFRPSTIAINFSASSLPVRVPDTLDLLLNTQLSINGPPKEILIRGEAIILEGTYHKDVNLGILQAIGEKKREEAPPATKQSLAFLNNIIADISIKHRNPFFVDNNLARFDISPDLRVSGMLSKPIITGRASIERGTITYRNKTFIVKKGIIDFTNPYRTEPTVDIQSEVQIRKWTIYLAVAGPPDRLSFELTSDPPEEDGDIVSLLLIGKTRNEFIKAERGTTQSAAKLLAGVISAALEEDIKRATGLDIVRIETQTQDNEATSDQIKVTLGKELSKRMTIKYTVEPKDGELTQRAIAEYKLLENIVLSGYQDNEGLQGGEIFFRLEFR
jgi:translocation and assembly module TamB